MTALAWLRRVAHKLAVGGIRLRCPNCEEGAMFRDLLNIHRTCPACGARFERLDGESIGGMAITLFVVPSIAIGGFILTDLLTPLPFIWNASVWLILLIGGCGLLYRHGRGAWVAVSYLTGGVYVDEPILDTTEAREKLVDAFRASSRPPHDDEHP